MWMFCLMSEFYRANMTGVIVDACRIIIGNMLFIGSIFDYSGQYIISASFNEIHQ